ncbi:ribonuclease H-like YkuK family protein [Aneurinibacillus uraniidurans]|uniref:ribonuclease H-like YkuK family protein n=1 Tax=Aneurinibacillus uraniidurans TaxID=2966586 RepID=UPI00234B1262|nr:ribonuclease H-like YkuK family protein [Aneurinibacillus sp. B1]WCN37610.1 ribonuclease H-like YkuK family protein [Aneurinibacillus sp. B1]
MNGSFYNLSEQFSAFEDVFERILWFAEQDPTAQYALAIGTDSHTYRAYTKFTTAILIHRHGRGAWGCLRDYILQRPIKSLREKISLETGLSEEIAYALTSDKLERLYDLLVPHVDKGADLKLTIHLDIGMKGASKELIKEMVGRVQAMGIEAKIKPDSYVASSYANRYTKRALLLN